MKIATDKRQHLIGTAAAAAGIVALVLLGERYGAWLSAGVGGTAAAWGFEWLQKYRGEGTPSAADAWYGTAGAWAVALAAYLLLNAG